MSELNTEACRAYIRTSVERQRAVSEQNEKGKSV